MATLEISPPFSFYADQSGVALEAGYIYIGVENLNPRTRPIIVYWDASGNIPAAQPIRTMGGYPSRVGTPGRLYIGGGVNDYSIAVYDKRDRLVYSLPTAINRQPQSPVNLERAGLVTKLWSFRTPGGEGIFSSAIGPVNLNGVQSIVFCGLDWYIYAIRVSNGTQIWRTATADQCYGRCQAADVNGDTFNEVFAPSHDGNIWSLDKAGVLRWKFANLYDREGSGTSTSATATTVTDTSKAWAANAFLRFQGVGFGASLRFTSGPASGQTREVVGNPGGDTLTVASAYSPAPTGGGGDAYVIDPKYVSDKYFQHAGTLIQESGTYYLYSTGFDNHVYKINANTGALVWKYATLENIEPYPLIATIAGSLRCIVVSIDEKTRSLDAATGSLIWQTDTGPCDAFLHAADVDDDGDLEILVSSRDNRVYILDGTTGAIQYTSTNMEAWDYGDVDCAAVPIRVNDEVMIAAGGDGGTVWALDSQANTIWSNFVLPNVINASPFAHVAYNNKPHIFAGDDRGALHCINAETGVSLGAIYVKGKIEGIPLYGDIDGDGAVEVVITTGDGYVNCYRFTNGAVFQQDGTPGNTQWQGKQN